MNICRLSALVAALLLAAACTGDSPTPERDIGSHGPGRRGGGPAHGNGLHHGRTLRPPCKARMAAARAAAPTSMAIPTPTPVPTPTRRPCPLQRQRQYPLRPPTPTPIPTPTADTGRLGQPYADSYIPTPTPDAAVLLSAMVGEVRPAVVRIEDQLQLRLRGYLRNPGQYRYVVTNHHVVEGNAEVRVTVGDSLTYLGTVLGTDPTRDLAVVRICCGSFKVLPFGDSAALRPGDAVVAIGYALGLQGQGHRKPAALCQRFGTNQPTVVS